MDEKEAVAEVDGDQGERGGDERNAEAVHLAEQRPRELEPELLPVDGEQCEIDEQRADEVPDDDAERALLPDDDEQNRGADRDGDVGQAREHECGRALLGAEEGGQLLVVHLRPDADEAGADEVRVVEAEQVGQRGGEEDARDEPERRARHREPERGADDEPPLRRVGRVEVEAEERRRDPGPQDRDDHSRERDDQADLTEVGRGEVTRVERQQEDREHARDDPAEPVDGRVAAEPSHLQGERRHR